MSGLDNMSELFKLIEHCREDYSDDEYRAKLKADIDRVRKNLKGKVPSGYEETLKRQVEKGWITKAQAEHMLQNAANFEVKESAITTEITDMGNNVIARMLEDDDVIELRTITGTPIGRYVKATNTTTDMMNNALAKGNILVTMIKKQ